MASETSSQEWIRESEKEFRQQVGALYPFRRKRRQTRAAFEKSYRILIEKQFPDLFADPLLALQYALESSVLIVALSSIMENRRFSVAERDLQTAVPRGLQRLFDQRARNVMSLIGTLIDVDRADREEEPAEQSLRVKGSQVKRLLIQTALLRLFTAIEVYLQETLVQALSQPEGLAEFSKNVDDEDVPAKWPDGRRIRKSEYASRWGDIVTLMLRFPYHEFEGRVSYRYRACFGFDLRKFRQLRRLIHYRDIRHRLVHQGSMRLGVPLVEVSAENVLELAGVAYNLADFVERSRPRIAKTS